MFKHYLAFFWVTFLLLVIAEFQSLNDKVLRLLLEDSTDTVSTEGRDSSSSNLK
jgi:hypothetical protein